MTVDTRVFSFGGGVQSMAVLVLAAMRELDVKNFVFANTGDDSESPETLRYLREVALPFAESKGLDMHVVQRPGATLYEYSIAQTNRTIPLPVRMSNGAPGTRKCTSDWKIKPVARFTKRELGATRKAPAIVGIGISTDEITRAKDSLISHQEHEFPLLDLRLSRSDCANVIREAGLPVPPKSSCWFCPYKKMREWTEMATNAMEMFERACQLEDALNRKRVSGLGKDKVWLSGALKPLRDAVLPSNQLTLDLDTGATCGSYCWT